MSMDEANGNSNEPVVPLRFEVELEFVQCLANPQYVNYLAQNNYLEDEQFIEYLKYLEYWRAPKYAKFIVYPNCLHMLALLQQPSFRKEITRADLAKMLMDDYYMRWLSNEPSSDGAKGTDVSNTVSNDAGNEASQDAAGTKPVPLTEIKQEQT